MMIQQAGQPIRGGPTRANLFWLNDEQWGEDEASHSKLIDLARDCRVRELEKKPGRPRGFSHKSLRQDGIKSQETHLHAMKKPHLPRRRHCRIESGPRPPSAYRISTNRLCSIQHSVQKATSSPSLRKAIFAPFLWLFETGALDACGGGLASVLDVPGGCISVPGWRCRRTCRRLPLQKAPAIWRIQPRRRKISPPRAHSELQLRLGHALSKGICPAIGSAIKGLLCSPLGWRPARRPNAESSTGHEETSHVSPIPDRRGAGSDLVPVR
jgi:hypothetical protein